MRYLFFTNTPAHVHLYKHAVRELADRGHEVLVLGRDYGCTVDLLDYYGLPYRVYGRCGTTKFSLFRELPSHYLTIAREIRRFRPDLIFGMGGYAAHGGALARVPVVLILDSEPTSLDHFVSRPFAKAILTPRAFGKDLGERHYRFNGFKENAYLHPDVFTPSTDIRAELGVGEQERFAIVRFNAFGSHHDFGHEGFTPERRRELVDTLAQYVTVFVSDEAEDGSLDGLDARPFDLHPALLHDALAEADLLVADTQTMVTEAALLGTPAIRSNSFVGVGDMGNFVELERQGLILNVAEFDEVLTHAEELLADPTTKAQWQARRDSYLTDKVNLTETILDIALNLGSVESARGVSKRQPVAV